MESITPEAVETHTFAANVAMPSTVQFNVTPELATFASPIAEPTKTLIPFAAYDIGSGGTKFMGALVNVTDMTIEEIFTKGQFSVPYREDLYKSENNEFSDLIQDLGLNALQTAKLQIEQDYSNSTFQGYGEIQHFAVATAAFREAKNGEFVASYFEDKLDIPISIISQEEEGKLAYYSVFSQMDQTELGEAPVVWDIGGGSMQLTFKDQADYFHVMQGQLASQTFQSLVCDKVLHKEETASPNPLNTNDVEAAIDLAKEHLTFDPATSDIIKHQIAHNAPVLAVGSVHNFVIQPLCNLAGVHPAGSEYTKEDLHQAILLLTDKTDEQIMKITALSNPDLAKNQLTNLILVYAMMDIMGIDKVHTVKSSNVEGLIIQHATANKKEIQTPINLQEIASLKELNDPFVHLYI